MAGLLPGYLVYGKPLCRNGPPLETERPGAHRANTPGLADEAEGLPTVTPLAASTATPVATATTATLGALLLRPGFIHD
jgi:hypothetical protein